MAEPAVALLAKPGHGMTGVGRYVRMLGAGLPAQGVEPRVFAPSLPPLPGALYRGAARLGVDAAAFLRTYPVWAAYPPARVYHFTSQNLASALLLRRPPGKLVITVHDIIPWLLRDDPALGSYRGRADRLFDRWAMAGLRRADLLVADSEYTRGTLVEALGLPAARIVTVPLAIEHEHFRPLGAPGDIAERYGLDPQAEYVIYVGSEDPRKNLGTLLEALAELRRIRPAARLLKVGRAHFAAERERLERRAAALGLADAVRFLDDVPEADLPALYNLAAACAMPSLYEGFGFPLLEAMACGTPVAYCAASSLPELAGPAGLAVAPGPGMAARLAEALGRLLGDGRERAEQRALGLARAAEFRWELTCGRMAEIYRGL